MRLFLLTVLTLFFLKKRNREGIRGTKESLVSVKMVLKISTWYTKSVAALFPLCVPFLKKREWLSF
jgi:hypothetical protein